MPIIEVTHLTKEYRLGALQSIKHTALDDIATGAALAAKTWNWCLTPFDLSLGERTKRWLFPKSFLVTYWTHTWKAPTHD